MKKLLYLESLRGIAAASVALHHFSVNSILQNNYYVKNSYLMVDFFFVLSGFVIAYNYMDKLTNTKNLINFQIKRFLRLYPLHFLVLLAFLFKENAIYYFEKVTGVQPNTPVFSVNNLESLFSIKEVDGYIIGPYDLSASMGIPGQFENKDFLSVMERIKTVATECNMSGGIHIIDPDTDQLKLRLDEGYRFIAYSLDIRMIDVACRKGVNFMKKIG